MTVKIQLRRGTAEQWTSANPTLLSGEQGLETDTSKTKIGDGTTAWNSLGYVDSKFLPTSASSSFVGLTNTQTLTNKTISGANNTLTNIAQASVTSLTTDLSAKAPLASPTLTGTPAAPTAAANTNTTQIATTAFVTTADNLKANLASPTFTGTPAAPTAAVNTNTTQVATTEFVNAEIANDAVLDSLFTAKGQVLSSSGSSVPVVVGAGTNGFVLTADSAQTAGVKWAAPSGDGLNPFLLMGA
jgi:hypothetical protein